MTALLQAMAAMPMDSKMMFTVHVVLILLVGWQYKQRSDDVRRFEHRMDRLEDALWKTPPRYTTHDEDDPA